MFQEGVDRGPAGRRAGRGEEQDAGLSLNDREAQINCLYYFSGVPYSI